MTLEALLKQWPRPRVGERVRLRNGKIADVLAVRGAMALIKMMTDAQPLQFWPMIQATYGTEWKKIYYQADIMIDGAFRQVEPRDVEEVLPPA